MLDFFLTGIAAVVFVFALVTVAAFLRGAFYGWRVKRLLRTGEPSDILRAYALYNRV